MLLNELTISRIYPSHKKFYTGGAEAGTRVVIRYDTGPVFFYGSVPVFCKIGNESALSPVPVLDLVTVLDCRDK